VKDLVQKLEDNAITETKLVSKSVLASLRIQIDDCSKDVYIWIEEASLCHPGFSSGNKASFKKFLVALENRQITDIYQDISNHKENIVAKLTVVGR
jgi:hypothetical protein